MQIVVLIDRSGSMSGKESDVKGGFKSFLNEHKNTNAKLTLVQFDDKYEPMVSEHLSKIDASIIDTYKPRGSTSLRDAVAKAITEIEDKNVLFVIITDGQENSSIEYGGNEGAEKLKKLISSKEAIGWKFIYMGANQDSFTSAQNLGINKGFAVDYKEEQTAGTLSRGLSYAVSAYDSGTLNEATLRAVVDGSVKQSSTVSDAWNIPIIHTGEFQITSAAINIGELTTLISSNFVGIPPLKKIDVSPSWANSQPYPEDTSKK